MKGKQWLFLRNFTSTQRIWEQRLYHVWASALKTISERKNSTLFLLSAGTLGESSLTSLRQPADFHPGWGRGMSGMHWCVETNNLACVCVCVCPRGSIWEGMSLELNQVSCEKHGYSKAFELCNEKASAKSFSENNYATKAQSSRQRAEVDITSVLFSFSFYLSLLWTQHDSQRPCRELGRAFKRRIVWTILSSFAHSELCDLPCLYVKTKGKQAQPTRWMIISCLLWQWKSGVKMHRKLMRHMSIS